MQSKSGIARDSSGELLVCGGKRRAKKTPPMKVGMIRSRVLKIRESKTNTIARVIEIAVMRPRETVVIENRSIRAISHG